VIDPNPPQADSDDEWFAIERTLTQMHFDMKHKQKSKGSKEFEKVKS
jgi:hypothetical protein